MDRRRRAPGKNRVGGKSDKMIREGWNLNGDGVCFVGRVDA